ncbi:MAG: restriction endonuclease subunit S [Nanoarchaeota archaeon]
MKGKQLTIGENQKQEVFYNNLSTYLKLINLFLSKNIKPEKLGKYIKILGGYAFKSSLYQGKGIPVIRISDFNNERIDLSNAKYCEERPEYDKYQLFEGDIIIAMTGGTIGKLGIVQGGLGKLYLNQRVGKFQILKPEEFFDKYVYWLARGIQERIKRIGYGGAQPNISGKQIEEIEFPIPDKKTQEKIINFLECLRDNCLENKEYFDEKTEKEILKLQHIGENLFQVSDNSQNDELLLTKFRQSILSEAVQGKLVSQNSKDEPASELLKKIKKEKEKLIKEGKIKKQKPLPEISEDEIPYDLPEGWVWCRLGEVCEYIQRGKSPKYSEIEKVPVISQKCVQWKGFEIEKARFIEEESLSKYENNRRLQDRDLLWNSTGDGTIGRICLYKEKLNPFGIAVADSHVTILRSFKKYILPEYVLIWNSSSFVQENLNVSGSTKQTELGTGTVQKQLIPLPPLPEQRRIVEKVDALMGFCDELEERIKENKESIEQLMNSVLREVFRR